MRTIAYFSLKITMILLLVLFADVSMAAKPWIDDPSANPLRKAEGETWRSSERYRILADFNGDGIEDLALSYDTSLFGNGGGHFSIYLRNAEGKYQEYDDFGAHPSANSIALEKWGKEIRLWTYLHGGGGTGSLGYYEVTEEGLSERRSIETHPGDSGTAMGNAIIKAVFENSYVNFTVQQSTTVDGKIEWK